ncbi:MAG: DUF1311 domain-containing protein [Hyphomonadaceae bacterium]|nr:DUF1311 domain-containing protein [Hyphomonadaceae bacterium]
MRKIIFAVLSVVALGVALPAAAQQPDRDRRGEDTQSRDWDRNGATQAELAAADRRLNQIYQRRIIEARAADRAYGRRNGDDRYDRDREGRSDERYGRTRDWYSQEAALREAERNWIAYRDNDCRYIAQPDVGRRWYTGTLRGCLLDRTNERIVILREARMEMSSR